MDLKICTSSYYSNYPGLLFVLLLHKSSKYQIDTKVLLNVSDFNTVEGAQLPGYSIIRDSCLCSHPDSNHGEQNASYHG
jgi:hypothetical protein